MTRFLAILITAACLLPQLHGAEEFEAKLKAGFGGGTSYDSRLTPVRVTIENKKQNDQGAIVLRAAKANAQVLQIEPVESPAPSVKQYTILARPQDNSSMDVLVNMDEIQEGGLIGNLSQRVGVNKGIIVSLGLPDWYRVPEEAFMNDEGKVVNRPVPAVLKENYYFRQVKADEFVDLALAYDCVDAVALNTRLVPEIDPAALNALAEWVELGGRLIFVGPERPNAFIDTLPVFGLTTTDLTKPSLHRRGAGWIGVDCPDGQKQKPMWIDDTYSLQAQALFPRIFHQSSIYGDGLGGGYFPMLTQKEGTYGVKGFFWLTMIILAYLAVIGPLDWWLVKKLGRPYLTWFFFIGAIALFSMVAYWYSSFVHSDTMQAIQINFLDTAVDGNLARGDSLYWLYSPKNFTYEITTPREDVVFSARENATLAGRTEIYNGTESRLQSRIPIFASRTIDATWVQPWDHQIGVDMIDGNIRVSLPPELNARAIQLATRTGVQALEKSDEKGVWIGGTRKKWDDFFMLFRDTSHFIVDRNEGLPPRAKLEDMARVVSFVRRDGYDKLVIRPKDKDAQDQGGGILPPDPNAPYTAPYSAQNTIHDLAETRDGREHGLNIRGRTDATGRVLFIILEDDAENLLPIQLNSLPPQQITVNVLRIQIP